MGIVREIKKSYKSWKREKERREPTIDRRCLVDIHGKEVPFDVAYQASRCKIHTISSYSVNQHYYEIKGYATEPMLNLDNDYICCRVDRESHRIEEVWRKDGKVFSEEDQMEL